MHVEEIVLNLIRAVFVEIVNHNLRVLKIGEVGECVFITPDDVNCEAGETVAATSYRRRNFMSNQNGISFQINQPD